MTVRATCRAFHHCHRSDQNTPNRVTVCTRLPPPTPPCDRPRHRLPGQAIRWEMQLNLYFRQLGGFTAPKTQSAWGYYTDQSADRYQLNTTSILTMLSRKFTLSTMFLVSFTRGAARLPTGYRSMHWPLGGARVPARWLRVSDWYGQGHWGGAL